MQLSEQDANLVIELMSALQYDVNRKLRIIPQPDSLEEYKRGKVPMESKFVIRNAIYENPHLIQEFVKENPNNFDQEKLAIVEKWQHFVKGRFIIERYLRKGAIFIGDGKVYSVLALNNSLEDFYPKFILPVFVETVLVPFKNVIVYDGFLQEYSLSFGSGMRSDFREMYLTAKQNETIIYSLDSGIQPKIISRTVLEPKTTHFKSEIEELILLASKLRGGNGQHFINGPVFSLVKASLNLASEVINSPNDADKWDKSAIKVESALRKVIDIINRME
jgi:hypothetical protein